MNDERWTMNQVHLNFGMRNAECGTPSPTLPPRGGGSGWGEIRNPQSGITLIEVILIMVIIGILAATVVPRIDFTLSITASVEGTAYMIASDIRYVQEWAMANRVSKTVTFATATPTVYTFSPSSSLDPSGQLPSGVTISNDFSVTFNSLGEPITTTPPGVWSVTVSAGGQSRTITVVNYTGKVNIT